MRMVTYIRGYKGWSLFNHHKFISLKSASGTQDVRAFHSYSYVHKPLCPSHESSRILMDADIGWDLILEVVGEPATDGSGRGIP